MRCFTGPLACLSGVLCAAVVLLCTTLPARAAAPDEQPADAQPKRDSTLGGLLDPSDLVRQFKQLVAPERTGLWQELIDQPYYTPLIKADKLLFHGQYAAAERQFDLVLKGTLSAADRTDATAGRLASILRQGRQRDVTRFATALEGLDPAQQALPRIVRLRAEALVAGGQVDEAVKVERAFVAAHPAALEADVLGNYVELGDLLEEQAEFAAAAGIYQQVVDLGGAHLPDDPAVRTWLAHALNRASVLAGQGKDRHAEVLEMLSAALRIDRTYWPAHLEMARVLLENHNLQQGGEEVAATLDLNPRDLAALELALSHAIDTYSFDQASELLAELKAQSDTGLVQGLEGRLLLKQRLPDQALAPLQAAVAQDPARPALRGWYAGALLLTAQAAAGAAQLQALPGPSGQGNPWALYEAAEVLRDARQFTQAEALYRQAAAAAPWWSEPYAALAQLYLEIGADAPARAAYNQSFAIDPYNMRAYNQLQLLDYLDQFKTLETAHFIIRYTAADALLAQLAAGWLEEIYPEVTSHFSTTLTQKTKIEMYPSHEQFGVRTTGLPWIGTVGACTGPVIAMDVPRARALDGGQSLGTFDWARVLRHEFTHTVTLAATDNRIPHWLTEACAQDQELAPRDWDSCQLLASNYRAGTLFTIADLNWGFIRPKRSIDRQLAYLESQWLYDYLEQTHGHAKMLEFLAAFKDQLTERQAFQKVYGQSPEQIDTDFLAWAGRELESWGLPSDKLPSLVDAQNAVRAAPRDADARCTLAWLLLSTGQIPAAETQLRAALRVDPEQPRARELLGVTLAALQKYDAAKAELAALVAAHPDRPVAWRTLGQIAMKQKNYDDAEKAFRALQEVRPLESTSYQNLAGIYLMRGDTTNAIAQLRELQRHEQYDDRIARRLAELLLQKNQLPDAQAMAFKAVRISPFSALDQHLLGRVLVERRQPAEAIQYLRYATELQPSVASYWTDLAAALNATGQTAEAQAATQQAAKLDAASGAAPLPQ